MLAGQVYIVQFYVCIPDHFLHKFFLYKYVRNERELDKQSQHIPNQ